MNKRLSFMILGLILALPVLAQAESSDRPASPYKEELKAHRTEQQQENQDFRKTLKDLPEEQRTEAVIDHRNQQFEENVALHEKIHQERITKLQEKLQNNPKLTDQQKQEALSAAEKAYQEKSAVINNVIRKTWISSVT